MAEGLCARGALARRRPDHEPVEGRDRGEGIQPRKGWGVSVEEGKGKGRRRREGSRQFPEATGRRGGRGWWRKNDRVQGVEVKTRRAIRPSVRGARRRRRRRREVTGAGGGGEREKRWREWEREGEGETAARLGKE